MHLPSPIPFYRLLGQWTLHGIGDSNFKKSPFPYLLCTESLEGMLFFPIASSLIFIVQQINSAINSGECILVARAMVNT